MQRAVSYHAIHADTYITASSPTSTYNASTTGQLSDGPGQESRLLLRFPMNYTSSDTVHEASIDLECTTDVLGPTELTAYVASMSRMWNGSYASGLLTRRTSCGPRPGPRTPMTVVLGSHRSF